MADDARTALVRQMVAENTSDEDITAALKVYDAKHPPTPPKGQVAPGSTFSEKIGNAASMLGDVMVGAGKGFGSSVANLGEMAVNAGLVPGQVPSAFNSDFRNPLFQKTDQATTATNIAQRVGKIGEQIGEAAALGLPTGGAAVEAIPSAARAGAKFAAVKAAAKDVPVDLSQAGDVALRIADLAQRGGGTNFGPGPVRQFLQWATDPKKEPMTYDVARDFASNISRLSSKDMAGVPPAMMREIANLRVTLNKAVGEAAGKVGMGQQYSAAMTEYAKAMHLRDTIDSMISGAQKAAPYMTAAGLTYYLSQHLGKGMASLFGGD